MRVNILKEGDSVLNITDKYVAVKRKSGEVEIIALIEGIAGLELDTNRILTIGYAENDVSIEVQDGVTIINF